jgi:uncharacterized protein Yka (UPF0111/DUF47 family)
MKSDILLTLIKEVVKNEVKQQVKEEIAKMIKSGAVTLNSQKKATPSLAELTEVNSTIGKKQSAFTTKQKPQQPKKEYTANPVLNEILNQTQPFTSAQRAEGGMASGGSVLDMLQPQQTMEGDWETMDYRDMEIPQNIPQQFESTGDDLQDATMKALTRDYRELVKRFK